MFQRKFIFLFIPFFLGLVFFVVSVRADHTPAHTKETQKAEQKLEQLKDELGAYESQLSKLQSTAPSSSNAREKKQLEEEIAAVKTKISELEGTASGDLELTRTLSRGVSGDDVKKLQEFLAKDKEVYPEGLATGHFGKLTEDAVRRFQEKNGIDSIGIVGPKTRAKLNELSSSSSAAVVESSESRVTVPSPKRPAELPKPLKDVEVTKALKKGDTNEDVKKVQGFLKDFPEVYPNGLETGFYGEHTEKAVKKLQEKVGIKQTGEVDEKTKEILNLLLVVGEKKKPPKITDVTPASGSAGITVTLTGKGFTSENNAIMMRGKIVATGLKSYDNNTQIDFILTSNTLCSPGSKKACPIKVVNANGISNAKPFKLTEFLLTPPGVATTTPPAPAPLPPPPPPPPPPPAPIDTTAPVRSNGLPFGELSYGTRNTTLSFATDENATCKYTTVAGTAFSSMTLQFSTTGGLSHYSNLTGLEDGKSYNYYIRCKDGAGNANADDFVISFNVASPPKPAITSISPSKGLVGTSVTINGSGFTAIGNSVSFAGIVAESNLSSADGKTLVFSVPTNTLCKIGETCTVSVANVNGTSNAVGFLRTQPVTPINVVFPNGGENLVQGVDFTLSWTGGTNRVDIVLVEDTAVAGSDPSAFIVGWIATSTKPNSTVNWNAKTVCSADGSVCTNIAPGKYKMMALSEDETGALTIWDDVANLPGNWDLSNSAFSISPGATLTVVVPNGGEIGSQNSAFIICWATIGLQSKNVKIELLKNGALYRTIYSSYAQTSDTGAFITNWIIPGDIPEGADYQVKISDATLPTQSDISDKPFSIVAATSAIKVYEPYGYPWYSSIWYSGFDGPVSWYGANVISKTVNINLWKGGFFYRSLATNVPQSYYPGGGSYTTGWFWKKVGIPADLPTGKDYTVEVVDAGNSSVRGFSSPFAVVQYPSYLTVKGRFTDYLTKAPLINTYLYNWDGSYWWYNILTNSNGEFNAVATTSDILLSRGHSFWAYPGGHNYGYFMVASNSFGMYAYVNLFPFVGKSYSFPISGGEVNFGEVPFWPFVDWGYAISDIPTRASINYRSPETGQSSYNLWYGSNFGNSQYLWKAVPQGLDVWARIEDKPGNVYYSPMLNLPATPSVPSQTLSLFNQIPKWEPYAISAYAWYYPYLLKVGTPLSYGYAYAYNGVAPYTWSVLSGSLPPGVTLSSSGSLSGSSTQAGVFDSVLRVQDANKVNGVSYPLRFDIRTEVGAEVPTIKVTYPQARQEFYPGGTYYIYWDSFGIASRAVVLDLYKGGSFVKKITGFAQSAEAGTYYYGWSVPMDLAGGTEYSIRVSDLNNSATYGESDLFVIPSRTTSFYWGNWKGNYMPYIWFNYATSTNPTATSYKLYQQKTGDTAPTVIATFSSPNCNQYLTSGKWSLWVSCYYWYPTPSWNLHYNTYAPASEFPLGEYTYELKAVDSAGVEKSTVSTKTRVFEAVSTLNPTSVNSPLSTSTLTFRWTIPTDWPTTVEKPYYISVWDASTGYYVYYGYGLSAPGDTTGLRKYDGPALDPTKKYGVSISYQRSLIDSVTAAYTGYISMNAAPITFWVGP